MKVISYARFSSPKQARGDSMRRQMELAQIWCDENGAQLDSQLRFSDEGISGWSGANAKTGALAALLRMVAENKISKGTILLVEALDRLTRTDLTVAVPLLIQLVNSGLIVITLQDKKRWTKESLKDMPDFMHSVLMLARGHDESQRKSEMVRAAYEEQRTNLSREAFGSAPGWLQRDDKKSDWRVIKEKAYSVQRVFEMVHLLFRNWLIKKIGQFPQGLENQFGTHACQDIYLEVELY